MKDMSFNQNIPQKYITLINRCLVSCIHDIQDEYSVMDYDNCQPMKILELLTYLAIPHKYQNLISDNLVCPQCRKKIKPTDTVVADLSAMEQIFYKKKFEYISKQTKKEIDVFYKYLSKYPYLGAEHETGKKISQAIRNYENLCEITDTMLYRARSVVSDKIYTLSDMKAPNPLKHIIYEGRYNHFGQSHFYLSFSEETSQLECCKSENAVCWIQKIKIHRLDRVLDLNKLSSDFPENESELLIEGLLVNRTLTKKPQKNRSWKPQYFVTRFIADICKKNGISAIIYPSSQTQDSNIVIFSPEKLDYEFIGEPYLYSIKGTGKTLQFDKS